MNAFTYMDSPIGRLLLTSDGAALTGLYMEPHRKAQSMDGWVEDATVEPLSAAVQQLTEYFAGARREFDLPLRLRGTPFQQRVWRELTEIPYGETWSYGQLAKRQSHFDHGALPQGDRCGRFLDGIRRRLGAQALAAGA